ncbi:TonB-dependent receptor [Dysgonomonas sp. ZJ709]|uniref:TonB-dependent receptor n=1 Tax=Dysgonomonas sp. ZJ709 TaxID=2709797 RepID=UPI0013EB5213|nr:TonB-dependent receptor [Dysgonomonas sp. ZJ709]
MKLALLTLIILFSVQFAFAQSKISGTAVDLSTSSPIEFTNIALLHKDSTFVKGIASDEKGYFVFDNIPDGDYLLTASYVGYEKKCIPVSKSGKDINVGNVTLQTSDVSLGDVTVNGNSVIRKVDRQVIMPTEAQLKVSTNGVNLLQSMQLPRLYIDPVNNAINISGGGEVQLRINGVLAQINDIVSIRPEDIIRIEFHDDPGLRYGGGVAAVIDYITRRKESGGNIAVNLMNGISDVGFAEDHFSAKANHKKSEFTMNAFYNYRGIDWTRENDETFVFPDKPALQRLEEGLPTKFNDKTLNALLNYSLVEQDKYYFNAAFRYNWDDTPHSFTNKIGRIHTSNNPDPLKISDQASSSANAPSLDLYFQRNLKNDQLIILNVVGTYIDSKNTRVYQEHRNDELVTDIFSHVVGNKYSLIAEGIYEKSYKESKLSTGIRHSQSYTDNKYSGTADAQVSMNFAETFGYVEYQFKKKKFNYTLGLGGSRIYYKQADNDVTTYFLRPTLRVAYTINDNTFIRYNGYISSYAPSLSDMNNVEQPIDSLQIRRGNPNLKSVWYLSNNLTIGYNKGIFGVELFANYNYDHQPVMSEVLFESGKFIQTNENQRSFHRLSTEVTFKLRPLKDYISLAITPGVRRFISNGNNYTHTYTNSYFRASLTANYKNWVLNAEMRTRQDWFWGESLNGGERIHILTAGYNKPNWSLMLGAINPFEKTYSTKSVNYSALTPSVSQVATDNIAPMFFVSFSCNINFGRQFKSANKRLNNDDSDSGIMSGTKK